MIHSHFSDNRGFGLVTSFSLPLLKRPPSLFRHLQRRPPGWQSPHSEGIPASLTWTSQETTNGQSPEWANYMILHVITPNIHLNPLFPWFIIIFQIRPFMELDPLCWVHRVEKGNMNHRGLNIFKSPRHEHQKGAWINQNTKYNLVQHKTGVWIQLNKLSTRSGDSHDHQSWRAATKDDPKNLSGRMTIGSTAIRNSTWLAEKSGDNQKMWDNHL